MAINFPEKYKETLVKGFDQKAETGDMFTHELDMEFSGVKTVHVTSLITEKLNDYDRSANPASGSRYGTPKDVQDFVYTYEMEGDKSLSLVIDKGNNKEQFNMKKAGEVMNAERNEVISPYMDKYRMKKWTTDAGIHFELPSGGLTKSNVVDQIMEVKSKMLDQNVPDQLTLTVKRTVLKLLKLSPEWVGTDALAAKTLPKGTLGEFDGMSVKTMAATKFPANVDFMISFKGSIIAPVKINTFKAHQDPPGLSGDLIEFRMIFDAFVLAHKCDGVAVGCANGTVVKTPTITVSGGSATIACATSGATIKYTTDGSDPRANKAALTYSSAVPVTSGTEIKAYAVKAGMFNSCMAEETA